MKNKTEFPKGGFCAKLSATLEEIAKGESIIYPRFVKWKRGRPTKAMKSERESFQNKFAENSAILRLLKEPNPIRVNEKGEVLIKYVPRNTL